MDCPRCNKPVWRTCSGVAYCLSLPFCTYGDLTEQQRDEVDAHIWSVSVLWRAIGRNPKDATHGGWRELTDREKRFYLAESRRIERHWPQSVFDALKHH